MRTLTLLSLTLLSLLSFLGVSLMASTPASSQSNERSLLDIERSHGCASDASARINRLKGLFDEAMRQLKRAQAGSAAHRDALRTIEVLEEQLRTAGSDLLRCLPDEAKAATQPEVVSTGEGNSMVRESGRVQLSTRVALVKGERIDGKGRHRSGEIARAVTDKGREIVRCYEQLLLRRDVPHHGNLDLVFTVDDRGALSRVDVEGGPVGDNEFRSCLLNAGRSIQAPPAQNGYARYAFEFAFGSGAH